MSRSKNNRNANNTAVIAETCLFRGYVSKVPENFTCYKFENKKVNVLYICENIAVSDWLVSELTQVLK